jgi:lactose/L-arabinose transport system permease protein
VSSPDLVATSASSRRRHPRRSRLAPYLFLLPFGILFVVFVVFGIVASLGLSLTNWKGAAIGGEFVGIENYQRLVGNVSFQRAFLHTVQLWTLTVPVLTFGGLALAWILDSRAVRFKAFFRTIFLLPVLPSLIVVGIVFLLLLDPKYGLPNVALRAIGLSPISLRTDTDAAIPVLAIMIIWRWLGYNMVIHLAGIQALPREVLEVARVDGASSWQLFWLVVVPMSRPILVFTSVLSTIGIFNLFDEAFVLFGTQGGPGESGLVIGTLLFREAFQNFNLGYASAVAFAVMAAVFVASLIQVRIARDDR